MSVATAAHAADPSVAPPALSVIVVTHNGRELALTTLESMMSEAVDVTVEWIVVDSGSTDGTPEAIEQRWPEIEVRRLDNVGFAAANNVGFSMASGRYLLALNPDTEVRWGSFGAIVERLDANPRVAAASVIQEEADGSFQCIRRDPSLWLAVSEALHLYKLPGCGSWQEREREPAVYDEEQRADWVVGAFLVLRPDAVQAVGGFDERFFMYSEEADLCRRIRDAGWEVRHLPVMRILHHGGQPNPRLVAQATWSRLEYSRKHFGRPAALAYRGVLAMNHLVRFAAFSLLPRRRERRGFEWHGLKVALGLAPPPFAPPSTLR